MHTGLFESLHRSLLRVYTKCTCVSDTDVSTLWEDEANAEKIVEVLEVCGCRALGGVMHHCTRRTNRTNPTSTKAPIDKSSANAITQQPVTAAT